MALLFVARPLFCSIAEILKLICHGGVMVGFVSPSEGNISLPVVIERKDNVLMCGLC